MAKSPLKNLCALAVFSSYAVAQNAPPSEALVLSLKTVNKALAGCRETYTRVQPGATSPLLKLLVGAEGYDKTMMSLDRAEKFSKFLIDHPDQIKGGMLVAILSTSDDFSVGIGSTRFEILSSLARKDSSLPPNLTAGLAVVDANLNACQKSLFNAGDDYVGLVLQFINAQDRLVGDAAH